MGKEREERREGDGDGDGDERKGRVKNTREGRNEEGSKEEEKKKEWVGRWGKRRIMGQ